MLKWKQHEIENGKYKYNFLCSMNTEAWSCKIKFGCRKKKK